MRDTVTLGTTTSKGITYWQARWTDPSTGKRRSRSLGRKDELSRRQARRKLTQLEAEFIVSPAKRASGQVPTLGQWCEQFIEGKRVEGRKEGTLALYRQAARYMKAYFGEQTRLTDITKTDARRFANELRACKFDHLRDERQRTPTRPATARKLLSCCRAVFSAADQEIDELQGNPLIVVKLGRSLPAEWRRVESETFWKLYAAADRSWRMVLALARLAALRRSDLPALRWTQVDLRAKVLRFRQHKTGVDVEVPVCPELHSILVEAPRSMRVDAAVVPRPVYLDNLGRDFRRLCRRAGVEFFEKPLHTMRKSCIDDWARSGYAPNVVQRWAGHREIQTTLRFYQTVERRDVDHATSRQLLPESDATLDATADFAARGGNARSASI